MINDDVVVSDLIDIDVDGVKLTKQEMLIEKDVQIMYYYSFNCGSFS